MTSRRCWADTPRNFMALINTIVRSLLLFCWTVCTKTWIGSSINRMWASEKAMAGVFAFVFCFVLFCCIVLYVVCCLLCCLCCLCCLFICLFVVCCIVVLFYCCIVLCMLVCNVQTTPHQSFIQQATLEAHGRTLHVTAQMVDEQLSKGTATEMQTFANRSRITSWLADQVCYFVNWLIG